MLPLVAVLLDEFFVEFTVELFALAVELVVELDLGRVVQLDV